MAIRKTLSLDILCCDEFVATDKAKKVGQYILGTILGEGRGATVRKGVRDRHGERVAVKCLAKYQSSRGESQRQLFRREVDSLRRLRHPNIVMLLETMETTRYMYLVLELIEGDTLVDVIKTRDNLEDNDWCAYTRQLFSAVSYIHRNDIVHRDIKPANILIVRTTKMVKLIDFGLSALYHPECPLTRQCGTPVYTAPEIYSGVPYGPPVDVWSLIEAKGHFDDADFPEKDSSLKTSYTYANSVCKHAEKLPRVKVHDFLTACDVEVDRQMRRRCQKSEFAQAASSECDPSSECISCQVHQLREDFKVYPKQNRSPDCKLCYRYRTQRASTADLDEASQTKAIPICRKASLKEKFGYIKTPPPPPGSALAMASPILGTSPSPFHLGTPDSEYDTGKRDQLIKKYITKEKGIHYECKPRERAYFYTDETAKQGIVHQPYHFHKRQSSLNTGKKKTTRSLASSKYSVSQLGLIFALPEHNPDLPERQESPRSRFWNRCSVLPPININRMQPRDDQTSTSPGDSRMKSATCPG